MTRKIRLLIRLLTFVPMAVCVIALFFLPDKIPAHYNAAGEVDRWGSKYEMLIFPGLIVITRGVMALMTYVATHGEGASENTRLRNCRHPVRVRHHDAVLHVCRICGSHGAWLNAG